MLAQLFAGAMGHQVAAPSGTAAAAAGTSDAASSGIAAPITAGAIDTARSSNGATADQALLSLLEQKLGADPADEANTQSSDTAAAATSSPEDKGAADGATVRPETVAQSLAQMGVASQFARNTHTVALQSNLGTPAWKDELGGQLTYMTHRGLESGSLRVSPEHLGPVEVQITVQNGEASVWFGASHPDTRAALEQALPRLREMFAQQGLALTDSGVSREPPRNPTRSRAPQSIAAVSATAGSGTSTAVAARISLGLVDTYA
jgi:flagellar hook-length control protein FliK